MQLTQEKFNELFNKLNMNPSASKLESMLADLLDNTASIIERSPGFAKVYMAEKAELLKVLTEGDKTL